jgi:hypothetical protein
MNRMGEREMMARFRLHRFEVLNNVGYMLATLAASHGLLSYSFFQELLGSSALFRPTVMTATVCLLVYFALRLTGLTREPMMSIFLTNVRGNGVWEDRVSSS